MKRALLIAGGTVGGLGAVLAITPPQLGSNNAINIAGAPIAGADTTASASASSSSPTPANAGVSETPAAKASATAKAKASEKASAAATKSAASSTSQNSNTQTASAASSAKSVNGSFTGPAVFVNYGTVQVKITVANGRITDAVAVQAPSGRNDRWTNMAVPILKQQTLAAQSANIQGASGASYTSYGWYTSLQGALAQAGL
jgi:uncharacterized protein with FMN-binding domain